MRTSMNRRSRHAGSFLSLFALVAAVGTQAGCRFDEGLAIHNLVGTVVVPRAAATRQQLQEDGTVVDVVDVRNIGPVYIGLFAAVEEANVIQTYPHPSIGPIYLDGVQGDTYPYGGTTIGDFRFACFDALTCRVTSGRYDSYDAIVEWFNDTLKSPIADADGRTVNNGEYFRQTCMDLMEVTSDDEVHLLPPDHDDDGKITAVDLDFVENEDGDFVGEFKIWQQQYFWDQEDQEKTDCTPGLDCKSFSVWAFMDGPSEADAGFTTCESDDFIGFEVEEYNYDFWGGAAQEDVLNKPGTYIGAGDWVSDSYLDGGTATPGFYQWNNAFDRPTIILGHQVSE